MDAELAPEDCFLLESTAAAAARTGDLERLQWLRWRGCQLTVIDEDEQEATLLESALEHAALAVVKCLVRAGCRLPGADEEDGEDEWAEAQWGNLREAAVKGPDALSKLRWLEERGAPPLDDSSWGRLANSGIGVGRVEVAEHVLSTLGPRGISKDAPRVAAFAGSVTALDLLHKAGFKCTSGTYLTAASHGRVAAVRWLVREAGVSAAGLDLSVVVQSWPFKTQEDSRGLLEAVQLLVGEAGCGVWRAPQVVYAAARRGDLALVQYLLQQQQQQQPGCQPPDWSVLVAAAEGGCEALLEWLAAEHPGCLTISSVASPYIQPAVCGDRGTLTALRRLGVPWGVQELVAQVNISVTLLPHSMNELTKKFTK